MVLLAVVTLAAIAPPRPAVAQNIKGEISVTVENGFARFVLQFAEEIETKVRVAQQHSQHHLRETLVDIASSVSQPIPVATWQRRVAIPTRRPFVRARAQGDHELDWPRRAAVGRPPAEG